MSSKTIMDMHPDKIIPEPNSGCWLWTGDMASTGYGLITLKHNGARRRTGAHRISCSMINGDLGANLALHKCDNKLCVNPNHLYVGNKSLNGLDAYARGKNGNQIRQTRENHHNSILTESQVAEIRALPPDRMKRGANVISNMAQRFGVSSAAIYDVRLGRSWQ